MTTKFLRNVDTGVIFGYNDIIAQQPWMVPYEEEELNEAISEAIVIKQPVEKEIKEKAENTPDLFTPIWFYNKEDGPVYRDVAKLANMSKITMDNLENFNPGPSDFRNKYNPMAIKAAVSEFKVRAKNGE